MTQIEKDNYEDEMDYEMDDHYEDDENENPDDIPDEDEQPLLNEEDVSLNVSCEIASISMSLDQVTKLKIGDIIEFIPWPGQVKLSLNGNYFAMGELVEINGMLGVKISSRSH